ncbi:hypothetical protein L3Q82_020640 [Scortum barcoo]|uniref:Uncharacterized protein n=1 Tax=Scortum barcoo TaxID=214431 RepID=A0ACB8V826_9TELE|nr:hypothetical protein L3Q82_020640 [Scortum barcoo]
MGLSPGFTVLIILPAFLLHTSGLYIASSVAGLPDALTGKSGAQRSGKAPANNTATSVRPAVALAGCLAEVPERCRQCCALLRAVQGIRLPAACPGGVWTGEADQCGRRGPLPVTRRLGWPHGRRAVP